ncbi:Proteasome assembly chaperone (PAC2) family protein [Quadrisphaera granulorum]|uniref:Proteasome assembly chaperone (PAC2) family protein n=2 Tax=Quadrisphaera granulorum TaxID=317664 RepID=A0A316A5F8_9ACTN|nr:PAC2 family protein [Quadrisphaera granulorum]PWJ53146.1 proteasome assembly chaperone (PAC2) family protein [Quadrisphaera granulorum]SZE97078.1 Proteasome assembly chaperone (PAC2) family protein [Quadrisphaera granulorum]
MAAEEHPLAEPVMLAAFEGWNDAGEAASGALDHLRRVWGAELVAELDPEEYHDFQVNRPQVSLDDDGKRSISWPTTRIFAATAPVSGRTVVLVHGIEPSMRWRRYTGELLEHARNLGVETVITMGALLADVPHTRPIPVSSTTDDTELLRRLSLERSTYEGPTGIVGVVSEAAASAGLPSLSLWAAVPHYVGQSPSPKAVLALLGRIEEVLGEAVPLGDLTDDARAWEHGVDELAGEDAEIGEYVRQLEEAKDTADLPEATGEAIAREFERYLRRRPDEGKDGLTGL